MTYTTEQTIDKALQQFRQFDGDTQLALLWFGYLDLKENLHPAPTISVTQPADAVYDQIKALPKEQQLQAQRDIAACANTPISRAYGALSPNSKLQVWLSLAQGMEEGSIIGMPENYKLPEQTNEFVQQIKQLDFEQRVNFSMASVERMGAAIQ